MLWQERWQVCEGFVLGAGDREFDRMQSKDLPPHVPELSSLLVLEVASTNAHVSFYHSTVLAALCC